MQVFDQQVKLMQISFIQAHENTVLLINSRSFVSVSGWFIFELLVHTEQFLLIVFSDYESL